MSSLSHDTPGIYQAYSAVYVRKEAGPRALFFVSFLFDVLALRSTGLLLLGCGCVCFCVCVRFLVTGISLLCTLYVG